MALISALVNVHVGNVYPIPGWYIARTAVCVDVAGILVLRSLLAKSCPFLSAVVSLLSCSLLELPLLLKSCELCLGPIE